MLRILTKLGLSLSSVTGTFFVGRPLLVNHEFKEERIEENAKELDSITKFEDIEIYAKKNGCSFVFVKHWKNKWVYSPEIFEEKHKSKNWKEIMRKGADGKKSDCKEGKTLVFARDGNSFIIKRRI